MGKLKKALLIAVVAVMASALTACGGGQGNGSASSASNDTGSSEQNVAANGQEHAGPHLDIVGAFYGDLGSDATYRDLCIVFDYVNDDTNRTLPASGDDVTVKINDANVYAAADNETMTLKDSQRGSYKVKTFDFTERYTGYRYPVGYGDILGGSEPIRMFASFLFNPNDFNGGDTITLTVGDVSGEFPVSEATEMMRPDDIMKVEPDFETAQILAAEKWRLDAAVEALWSLADNIGELGGGDWASGYSQSMKNHFSSASGGLSVFEEAFGGFHQDTHTFFTVVDTLPAYDHDVVVKGYPEAADLIDSFESKWLELSDSILVEGTDKGVYTEQINSLFDTYHEICDTLGIGRIKNL